MQLSLIDALETQTPTDEPVVTPNEVMASLLRAPVVVTDEYFDSVVRAVSIINDRERDSETSSHRDTLVHAQDWLCRELPEWCHWILRDL